MPDIREVLDLERIDRDIYRGPVIESVLQRTFGGQVALVFDPETGKNLEE